MRAINPLLAADFANGHISTVAQVIRTDGVVQSFCDFDAPLAVGSTVYAPAAGLTGIKLTLTNSASVSDVQTRAAWLPVLQEADVISGVYDNATVSFGFMSNINPVYGVLWVFSGLLSTIKATPDGFQASSQSAMWMLQRQLGIYLNPNCRHVLGSTVDPQGVGGCLLDLTPYTYTGTISSLVNPTVWNVSLSGYGAAATPNTPNTPSLTVHQNIAGQFLIPGTYYYSVSAIDANGQESATSHIATGVVLTNAPPTGGGSIDLSWTAVAGAASYNVYGNTVQQILANVTGTSWTDNGSGASGGSPPLFGDFFAMGILQMTSGAANGLKTDVKTMQNGVLSLLLPLGRDVAPADTFTITAGCSKSVGACNYKFNNVVNYGGFPDLTPERQWM